MSRTNLILLVVLVVLAGIWLATRDSDQDRTAGLAPRFFPEFNKEAADRIEIEGGWLDGTWVIGLHGSEWTLDSAGGYPVKKEEVGDFLDATYNLRRENLVGESATLRESTRTDERGRLVRIYKGESPMAEFRVGKNPERAYQHFFIRREDEDRIYRVRTLLTKDQEKAAPASAGPFDSGASGYSWDRPVERLSEWVETQIWSLSDEEAEELWLHRPDLDVKMKRTGDEAWELQSTGEEERFPADVDNVTAISSGLRYLYFADIAGRYDDVAAEYGLDEPEITLVMTLKRKVEKEPSEPADGQEGDGDAGEKEPEEFVTVQRAFEVGKRVKRPKSLDDETGEVEEEEYYAVHVSGDASDPEEKELAGYVFLLEPHKITPLRKTLEELKQEPPEEEPAEEETETPGDEEKTPTEEPAKETSEEPKEEPAGEPTEEPEEEPAEEPKEGPAGEPSKEDG
jgi:hypothetical protein